MPIETRTDSSGEGKIKQTFDATYLALGLLLTLLFVLLKPVGQPEKPLDLPLPVRPMNSGSPNTKTAESVLITRWENWVREVKHADLENYAPNYYIVKPRSLDRPAKTEVMEYSHEYYNIVGNPMHVKLLYRATEEEAYYNP